jgi:SAM-dependent methyltransferase
LKRIGYSLGLSDHPSLLKRRRDFSFRYIRGRGLEIGALHEPLPVRDGVVVEYVDVCEREQSISKFPELDRARIVEPTYIDDGFVLSSIPDASQDFVIANHVLEHSPNPIQAMTNWTRVLKPNGILFTAVPIADKCFDKGRSLTTLEHFIEDHELCQRGDIERFSHRNREHYIEYMTVSHVNGTKQRGVEYRSPSAEQLEACVEQMNQASAEIHFHTFSPSSYGELLSYFSSHVDPTMYLVKLAGGDEIVSIMRKSVAATADRKPVHEDAIERRA